MRVGDELLKRARGEQQRQNIGTARLVAGGNAIGKVVTLLLELRLLGVDLLLGVVDLTLHTFDIAEGLGILVGERRVLIGNAVELSLDLVELGLGGIQFVGGFLAGLSRMGAGGQAKKNSRGSSAEKSLEGSAARKLLRKNGIVVW